MTAVAGTFVQVHMHLYIRTLNLSKVITVHSQNNVKFLVKFAWNHEFMYVAVSWIFLWIIKVPNFVDVHKSTKSKLFTLEIFMPYNTYICIKDLIIKYGRVVHCRNEQGKL